MLIDFFSEHPSEFWFLLSAIFLILEVIFGFTIVLLFASLASFTLGIILYFGWIGMDRITLQLAYFFGFTLFWMAVAYRPLAKLIRERKFENNFHNIVGSKAVIINSPLIKNQLGEVKWSGSTFKANLAQDSEQDEIPTGTTVTIMDIKENTFIVK